MKHLALITIAIALTGCATNDYDAYAKAQADVARARADADTARYNALSQIAQSGTESARVAAVMALALGGNGNSQAVSQVQAPQNSQALQWVQALVPSLTSIAGMHYASRSAIAAADASSRISESTNAAFVGIAGKIQAPVVAAPIVPQANVSTVTTTTNDNHAQTTNTSTTSATTSTTSTSNPTTTTTSTSLGGSGVIGNGVYTASPVTTSNPVTTNTSTSTGTTPVTTTTPTTTAKVCTAGAVTTGPGC